MPTVIFDDQSTEYLESTLVPPTRDHYQHPYTCHSLLANGDKLANGLCDANTHKFTNSSLVLLKNNSTVKSFHTRPLTTVSASDSSRTEMTTVEILPDSPPDLSSSKSSAKSFSFQSSQNNDFNDLSHFEEISLAEGRPPMRNLTGKMPELKLRPLARTALLSASPPPGSSSPAVGDSSNESRIATTLNSHARNMNQKHFPRSSWQTEYHSNSSPTLNVPVNNGRRTPSPTHRVVSLSPNLPPCTSHPTLDKSPIMRSSRQGSWQQKRRKTAEELEQEYDDLDEEVPEDSIIWNVPLSPRPSHERSQSVSPERELLDNDKTGTRPPLTSRSMSWTAAMSELSDEARGLTEALETHADSSKWPNQDENHKPTSIASSSSRPSPHRASTVPLPPIQRCHIMVDPLPMSKEKERFLARTRPSWLPPKCKKEERKHVKEYQHMMNTYLASEKRKSELIKKAEITRDKEAISSTRLWEETVLANWDTAIKAPKTRELWWRGIPPQLRGLVWAKAVGNDLSLNNASYEAALGRAKALIHSNSLKGQPHSPSHTHSVESPNQEADFDHNQTLHARQRSSSIPTPLYKIHHSLALIHLDIPSVFPSLHLFQHHQPSYLPLLDLLIAYSSYRSDTGYTAGTASIAALLLLHSPSPSSAFILLANLLNRPTSLAFCLGDDAGKQKCIAHILKTLDHKLPKVADHLSGVPGLRAGEWLEPMCVSLFTNVLNREEVERVFDVLVFEGDGVVVRVAVAVVARWEGRLYGGGEDVLRILGWEKDGEKDGIAAVTPGQLPGKEHGESSDDLMRRVRWAGKEEMDCR